MASAWGTSWGTSWANSWGDAGAVVVAQTQVGGGRKRYPETRSTSRSATKFTRFSDEEWEKARKAFANARRKRKEIEERLEAKPAKPLPARAEKQLEQRLVRAKTQEAQAFDLMASIDAIMAEAFAKDAAIFYANQAKRITEEEEMMIVLLLVS